MTRLPHPAASVRGSRFRPLALAGLGAGALLGLVASSLPWWRATGSGVSVPVSGTEATAGLAQALALVVLAGAVLALVLRVRGRRVLGGLLALDGAGALLVGLLAPPPAPGTVRTKVLEVSLGDQFTLTGTLWRYGYAAGGLLVLTAAVLMVSTAGRWPVRTARFERATAEAAEQVTVAGRSAPAKDVAGADPAVLWRLLDAGVDPTATATAEEPASARSEVEVAPGVRPTARGDAEHIAQPPSSPPPNIA